MAEIKESGGTTGYVTQNVLTANGSLIPVVGISRKMQNKLLSQCNILDVRGVLVKCAKKSQRADVARKVGTSEKLVYSWVKQVNLWQLTGMTADMAYLLVLAGIRCIDDLAKVDIDKIEPILKALEASQVDFIAFKRTEIKNIIDEAKKFCTLENEDDNNEEEEALKTLQSLIQYIKFEEEQASAENNIEKAHHYSNFRISHLHEKGLPALARKIRNRKITSRFSMTIEHSDPEPQHLFAADAIPAISQLQQGIAEIKDKLAEVLEIGFVLPLPRVLTGKVRMADKELPCVGYDVSIEGVVSAIDDKKEADEKPSTTTDAEGNFVIVLPSRYSFKENVRLIVKQKYSNLTEEYVLTVHDIIQASNNNFNSYCETKKEELDAAWERTREAMLVKQSGKLSANNKGDNIGNLEEVYEDALDTYREYFKSIYAMDLFTAEGNLLEAKIFPRRGGSINKESTDFLFSGFQQMEGYNKAMPKVKLMENEDSKAIYLSTDTAPSKVYNYSMLQRLVEPDLYSSDNSKDKSRKTINSPISIKDMREELAKKPNSYPQMGTLGVGYLLNMHQAWVPDGFALGTLLYSLVLAPGEEQRLIVRENNQSYSLLDTGEANDSDTETYGLSQTDDSDAAFQYAVSQMMQGGSASEYETESSTHGWSVGASGGMAGIFGLSAGYSGSISKSSGNASTSAYQSNQHNEASTAAQSFQHAIQSAANKISQAKRVSISTATSTQSDSVATKIIANHNHSHAMTVQYWAVNRLYRLETAVDGIDLVLFVPMQLVQFLPEGQDLYLRLYDNNTVKYATNEGKKITESSYNKDYFYQRYEVLFNNYDVLYSRLPSKYRTGLSLIKKYWTTPLWELETAENSLHRLTFSFKVKALPIDKYNVTLVLKNGKGVYNNLIQFSEGSTWMGFSWLTNNSPNSYHNFLKEVNDTALTTRELKDKIALYRQEKCSALTFKCTFDLSDGVTYDDISYVSVEYVADPLTVQLRFDDPGISDEGTVKGDHSRDYYIKNYGFSETEAEAIVKMEDAYWEYLQDGATDDFNDFLRCRKDVPECMKNFPHSVNVTFSASELCRISDITISGISLTKPQEATSASTSTNTTATEKTPTIRVAPTSAVLRNSVMIGVSVDTKILHMSEVQKIEDTFTHIATNTMKYSQVLWSAMSVDERVMLLERYLIDLKKLDRNDETNTDIPLLNCIDVKKMLGFYGNCMLFPFTFPQALAEDLGVTAAELQNMLYAYHTNAFRAPTTTISLPTDGMIGEAVLGETNVSEKIDITRFWNWKDSDIDHMSIDNNYLNGNDYLKDKSTKDIKALNMTGASAPQAVTVPDLLSAMINKQTPSFNDITGLEQTASILNKATDSASTGRDKALEAANDSAKNAIETVKALGEYKNKQLELENKQLELENKKAENENNKAIKIAETENNPQSKAMGILDTLLGDAGKLSSLKEAGLNIDELIKAIAGVVASGGSNKASDDKKATAGNGSGGGNGAPAGSSGSGNTSGGGRS